MILTDGFKLQVFSTGWFTFNEMQMRWLQTQVMLSITRAPTCVLVSEEISIDARDERKSINTAVSPVYTYIPVVCVTGTTEAVDTYIFHTCATISDKYRRSTTCAYVYFSLICQLNWVCKI